MSTENVSVGGQPDVPRETPMEIALNVSTFASGLRRSTQSARESRKRIRRSLFFFYISNFLWKLGYGILYTTKTQMQARSLGGYASGAAFATWFVGGNYFIDFLFSPLWGVVGNKVGRKPLVMIFAIMKALPIAVLAVGAPFWLYLGLDNLVPLPGAISGGVAGAYIADLVVADHEEEDEDEEDSGKEPVVSPATAFAYCQAAMFAGEMLGTVVGPLLEDYFTTTITRNTTLSVKQEVKDTAYQLVCVVATTFYALNVVWVAVALPEPLLKHHNEKHIASDWSDILKQSTPVAAVKLIWSIGPLMVAYVVLMSTLAAVQEGLEDINDQFLALGMDIQGMSLADLVTFRSIILVVCNLVLTPFLIKTLGQRRAIYIGAVLVFVGTLLMGFAWESTLVYIAQGFFCLGSVWNPAVQGAIVLATPPSQQGEIQAALAAIMALLMSLAPVPFGYIFLLTSRTMPNMVFFIACAFYIIVVLSTGHRIMRSKPEERRVETFNKLDPIHHQGIFLRRSDGVRRCITDSALEKKVPLLARLSVSTSHVDPWLADAETCTFRAEHALQTQSVPRAS